MTTTHVYTASEGQCVYVIQYSAPTRKFRLTRYQRDGQFQTFHDSVADCLEHMHSDHKLVYVA